jgi:uncharacterized protein (TIGR03437 family)
VASPAGSSEPAPLRLAAFAPAVFLLADGTGAVTVAGVGRSTAERPAAPGEWVEIYATGLGAVRWNPAAGMEETVERPEVTIGGIPAAVYFSGHAPGWTGLYQINVQVPQGLASGRQPLVIGIAGVISRSVPILIR